MQHNHPIEDLPRHLAARPASHAPSLKPTSPPTSASGRCRPGMAGFTAPDGSSYSLSTLDLQRRTPSPNSPTSRSLPGHSPGPYCVRSSMQTWIYRGPGRRVAIQARNECATVPSGSDAVHRYDGARATAAAPACGRRPGAADTHRRLLPSPRSSRPMSKRSSRCVWCQRPAATAARRLKRVGFRLHDHVHAGVTAVHHVVRPGHE